MFWVSLMVTKNQKPQIDMQRIRRNKSKHTTMKNHCITKKDSEKKTKKRKIRELLKARKELIR